MSVAPGGAKRNPGVLSATIFPAALAAETKKMYESNHRGNTLKRVGLLATIFALVSISVPSFDKLAFDPPDVVPPRVSICEIQRDADRFDGRMIAVYGKLVLFDGVLGIEQGNCTSGIGWMPEEDLIAFLDEYPDIAAGIDGLRVSLTGKF